MTIRRPQQSRRAGDSGRSLAGRDLTVKVKTARGRRASSTRWLERQLNDPFVQAAKRQGYRGRAAFKLAELDDRFGLLRNGMTLVDLGCAPGGWLQVCQERVQQGRLIGVDLQEIAPLAGCTLLVGDIYDEATQAALSLALEGQGVDLVLSDMANAATGHNATDHLRVMSLLEAAWDFARQQLKPGGALVAKVLIGGAEQAFLAELKRHFRKVRHAKPAASRANSREQYLVALGYKATP